MSLASYGGVELLENEVNLRRVDDVRRFSKRDLSLSRVVTFYLEIYIQATGAALRTRIDAIRTMFATQYQDFLYKIDGVSVHGLTNAGSLTGVKVIQHSWPNGDATELANKRTASVTLQAEYPFADSNVVFWKESIRYVGTGGPRTTVEETYDGPKATEVAQTTAIRILQHGQAIGFIAHVTAPSPLFAAGANLIHHEDQFVKEYESGEQQGLVACYFPTRWAYPMTALVPPTFTLPTTI